MGDLRPRGQSLDRNFYYSIASIKLLWVLSLKFCLTFDWFDSKHHRNVVAEPLTLEKIRIDRWLSVLPRSQIYPQCICARHPLVLVRHRHQKKGKPGCHRWELMEEDVLVKHMKKGKPICSRHQMTGGTRGRLDLSMKYLIKTLRLKMSQSKFHADLASFDNTMNNAASRRRYVRHWQLHHSTHDLPVTYTIYASNQPIIRMCKF